MKKVSHFIDGKIYSDSKSRKGPIFNPAIGEQIAEVELASKTTVEKAIENSSRAFLKWSKTTPISRTRILSKYKDLLLKNMEEYAHCLRGSPFIFKIFREIEPNATTTSVV